ncbi:MAG: hypothetical protein NDJ89_11365 [Oligoflexia bacterium]|nr:hypothetical protein [Oligoflexia bacterium]
MHVAVGTERGFIAAALNPKATHLLLTDATPSVTLYNRINIALLKLAQGDLKTYRALRLKSGAEEWRTRAARLRSEGRLDPASAELLSSEAVWKNWKFSVRDSSGFEAFHRRPGREDLFFRANYLHDPKLFERISRLAREDRIQAVTMNLADDEALRALTHELKNARLKVSVVDLSNAWWPQYLDPASGAFPRMLGAFEEVADTKALLLLTSWNMDQPLTATAGIERRWGYFGFSFDRLAPAREKGAALQRYLWENNNHPPTLDELGEDGTSLRYAGSLNDRKALAALKAAPRACMEGFAGLATRPAMSRP